VSEHLPASRELHDEVDGVRVLRRAEESNDERVIDGFEDRFFRPHVVQLAGP
jgi:hypothetical protein